MLMQIYMENSSIMLHSFNPLIVAGAKIHDDNSLSYSLYLKN